MSKLQTILTDHKLLAELKVYVEKATGILHGQQQYADDMKEIEKNVKATMSLSAGDFKQVVKYFQSNNDALANQLNSLTTMQKIVEKLSD